MTDDDDTFSSLGPKKGFEINAGPEERVAVSESDGAVDLVRTSEFTIVCPDCGRPERFVEPLRAQAWIVGHYNAEHPDTLPRFSNSQTES